MERSDHLYVYPWLVPFSIDPETGQSKIEGVKHQAKYGSRQSPGDSRTRISPKKLRVALYARVSSQDQAEGLSLQAQTRRLKERTKSEGWILPQGCIYTEAVSAESLANRPQMLRALRDAEKDVFDFFAVMYQNRLARNTMDALFIAKQFANSNVKIWIEDRGRFADTKSKTGLLEFTMMAGIDTYQRMDIKERMDLGRQQARLEGRGWPGGPAPYGWSVEPILPMPRRGPRCKLVIDKKEAAIVRKYIFGVPKWSDSYLAGFLNEKGIPSKMGKRWLPKQVRRVRTSRFYCGEYEYQGQVREARDIPPIVNKKAWVVTQGALRSGHRNYAGKPKHLLTGIAFCAYCGSRYYVHTHKQPKGRNPQSVYYCGSNTRKFPKCIHSRYFTAWKVHEKLLENIKRRLNRPGFLETTYEQYVAQLKEKDPQLEVLALEGKIREMDKQKQRVVLAIAEATITKEEATLQMVSNRRYQRDLQRQLDASLKRTDTIPTLRDLKRAAAQIDSGDREIVRMIIHGLIGKIVFTDKNMMIHYRFWPRAVVPVRIRP